MEQMKKIRKLRGFKSAKAFAEYMGLNVSTYTAYEQGQHQPDIVTMWQIADALDCSIDQLVGRVPYAD